MKNKKIREKIKKSNVRHWEVAEALSIDDSTLCRWLRHELPKDKEDRIIKTIDKLTAEREADE